MTIFSDDSQAEVLMQTWGIYRAAVAYIIDFLSPHWDTVKAKDYANEKTIFVETLIHSTKDRRFM